MVGPSIVGVTPNECRKYREEALGETLPLPLTTMGIPVTQQIEEDDTYYTSPPPLAELSEDEQSVFTIAEL